MSLKDIVYFIENTTHVATLDTVAYVVAERKKKLSMTPSSTNRATTPSSTNRATTPSPTTAGLQLFNPEERTAVQPESYLIRPVPVRA